MGLRRDPLTKLWSSSLQLRCSCRLDSWAAQWSGHLVCQRDCRAQDVTLKPERQNSERPTKASSPIALKLVFEPASTVGPRMWDIISGQYHDPGKLPSLLSVPGLGLRFLVLVGFRCLGSEVFMGCRAYRSFTSGVFGVVNFIWRPKDA